MKNVILMVTLSLLLSACSTSQTAYDEKSVPPAMDNFDEAGIINRMTDIKNGLKPNIKPESPPAESDQPDQPAATKQMENLAAKYDSAIIKTNLGDISVKFYASECPLTVNSFMNLAQANFYDGVKFHRVIKDFMIQGGDPLSKDDDPSNDGTGGPGYQFKDEFNNHKLVKGSLAMANSGPDTNGSQFFIVTAESTPWLDGKHTNFGYVTNGLEVVEKIGNVKVGANDRPVEDVVINSVELTTSAAASNSNTGATPK